ncbi:glycosyltransferase 87 family protein [Bdellovibrionota bacterium FG-1]
MMGFLGFSLVSFIALVRLLTQNVPGHYRVFTGAGHAIWNGINPYASDFGTGVGYFFYSPFCAMTVFGPLSVLPEKLGMAMYMLISWGFFVWGVTAFWKRWAQPSHNRWLQWFWIAIAPQMFGGILASKLEIIIAGLLLLALAWLYETPRKTWAACTLLAMTLNWKFQSIPIVGLLSLAMWIIRRDWRTPVRMGAMIIGLFLLPFAFFSSEFLFHAQQTWQSSLSRFVGEAYLNYENLFTFLHQGFGLPFTFKMTQVLTGVTGVAFAGTLVVWLRTVSKRRFTQEQQIRGAILLVTALGSAFMTAFSPLGQNNALILYAPLLLIGFILGADLQSGKKGWVGVLVLTFVGMTLLYSDLVPLPLRNEFRNLSLKPVFCLGLGIAIVIQTFLFAKQGQRGPNHVAT